MSIVADIKQAKAAFEHHVATHHCRDNFSSWNAGQEPCFTRLELMHAWFGTAHMWGEEPDDDRRQREHYERNVGRSAA